MALSQELLEKLACPKCRGPVGLTPDGLALACPACALLYAIEDDIPCMLVELAKPMATSTTGPARTSP